MQVCREVAVRRAWRCEGECGGIEHFVHLGGLLLKQAALLVVRNHLRERLMRRLDLFGAPRPAVRVLALVPCALGCRDGALERACVALLDGAQQFVARLLPPPAHLPLGAPHRALGRERRRAAVRRRVVVVVVVVVVEGVVANLRLDWRRGVGHRRWRLGCLRRRRRRRRRRRCRCLAAAARCWGWRLLCSDRRSQCLRGDGHRRFLHAPALALLDGGGVRRRVALHVVLLVTPLLLERGEALCVVLEQLVHGLARSDRPWTHSAHTSTQQRPSQAARARQAAKQPAGEQLTLCFVPMARWSREQRDDPESVAVVWRWCGAVAVAVVWRWCGGGVEVVWRWCGGGVAVVWRWCGGGVEVVWSSAPASPKSM
jgi:hypothetical protein